MNALKKTDVASAQTHHCKVGRSQHAKPKEWQPKSCTLILLMTSWIVDESPMQLLCLLAIKFLAAVRTLKCSRHLDTNVRSRAVARLCSIADFHCLGHCKVNKSHTSCQ